MVDGERGSPGYTAPEVLNPNGDAFDFFKADVFSFGMTMYSILSNEEPFSYYATSSQVNNAIFKGERPDLDGFPSPIRRLIQKCWDHDPSKRPGFSYILEILLKYCRKNRAIDQNEIDKILEFCNYSNNDTSKPIKKDVSSPISNPGDRNDNSNPFLNISNTPFHDSQVPHPFPDTRLVSNHFPDTNLVSNPFLENSPVPEKYLLTLSIRYFSKSFQGSQLFCEAELYLLKSSHKNMKRLQSIDNPIELTENKDKYVVKLYVYQRDSNPFSNNKNIIRFHQFIYLNQVQLNDSSVKTLKNDKSTIKVKYTLILQKI